MGNGASTPTIATATRDNLDQQPYPLTYEAAETTEKGDNIPEDKLAQMNFPVNVESSTPAVAAETPTPMGLTAVSSDETQNLPALDDTTVERIITLVAAFTPLCMERLPAVYKKRYLDDLNHKKMGFRKLIDLLEAIPAIECIKQRSDLASDPSITVFLRVRTTEPDEASAGSPAPVQSRQPDETSNVAEDPTEEQAEDTSWVEPAIELWVGRALKAIGNINKGNLGEPLPVTNFEVRLVGEAKKSKVLRPNDYPPAKTYVREVVKGLRADPRLCWEKRIPEGIVYWASANKPTLASGVGPALINERIVELVSAESPLSSDELNRMYEERYHETIDFKKHGFKKLKKLVKAIPALEWQNSMIYLAGETKPSTPRKPKSATSNVSTQDLALAKERIMQLVAAESPLNASQLQQLYKGRFGQKLDYQQFGFSKMKALIDTIPSVECRHSKSGPPLCLVIREDAKDEWDGMESDASTATSYKTPTASTVSKENTKNSQVVAVTHAQPAPVLPDAFRSFYEFATKAAEDGNASSSSPCSLPLENDIFLTEDRSSKVLDLTTQFMEAQPTKTGREEFFSIGDAAAAASFQEMALLGRIPSDDDDDDDEGVSPVPVFLNTHIPFCMAAIGVQGAGKSHTLGCVIESCLLSGETHNIVQLQKPMTALVLHYDQSTTSVCEAAGLLAPNPAIPSTSSVPRSKAVVLVSPTYYKQRKAFYGDYCTVRPLLFKWNSLTADHIKRIMRIGTADNQLYVASFMTLLRGYQRKCLVPDFSQFMDEVKEVCNVRGQLGPLDQRIALLESIVAESSVNGDIVDESMDLSKALKSEMNLIIVDLTDPLLSKEEANSLFQVVTEQFRSIPVKGGKLLALDEAHKFMDGIKSDGLSEAIVNVARLMRHDGIRLAVSTQSPKALAPELLELVSIAMLHHFHSQDWWTYLRQKLPICDKAFEDVLTLDPGNALVFASRHSFESHLLRLSVRPRLTADFGASRTNK